MSTPTPVERPRKRQRVDATRFLDLEAAVDHDADTDDNEVGSEDDFINDDEDDAQENAQHIQLMRQLIIENDREREALEEVNAADALDAPDAPLPYLPSHFNLMDELYAHIRRRKHSASSTLPSEALAGDRVGQLEAWGEPVGRNWDFYHDIESRLPQREDMLFEIPCKRGYEDAAVLSIMFLATSPKCPRGGRLPSLAAAFSNPRLPGRIFLEVKMYSQAVDVARRVPHLKAVDIVEIDLVERLRPLQLCPPTTFKRNSWVRIERPISLRGRIGLVIETEQHESEQDEPRQVSAEVMVVPKGRNCNEDGLFVDAISSTHQAEHLREQPDDEDQLLRYSPVKVKSRIYCGAGFRYIQVKKSILVNGDDIVPPIDELSVFLEVCKISKSFYNQTLRRIQHQTLNEGDRVLLTQSDLAGLMGVFVTGDATSCRVYVPSLDIYVDDVSFEDIRRHFRVGDRVQTADPHHGMNGVPLWIVSLEGDQADLVNLADKSEHVANIHQLTFCDLDNVPLSIKSPPRKSRVVKGKVYTITFSQRSGSWSAGNDIRHLFGRITDIASFSSAIATLQFTPDSTFSPPVSSLPLSIGLQVELRDEQDLGGTAFISAWTNTYVTLINLSPDFEVLHNSASSGLYDRHVGKWVFVIAGVYKGARGLVKAVTADGRATVELHVFPLRREMIHVRQLSAIAQTGILFRKSDTMYELRLGQRLVPAPGLPMVPSTAPWAATAPPAARALMVAT